MEPTLKEILDAREARVEKQKALLAEFQKPLLCFTMNIPGPEKYNRDVSVAFHLGDRMLCRELQKVPVLHRELHRKATGCEGYYIVDLPAADLKCLAVDIEESESIGRLFDMDVLDVDGRKLSREELGLPRRQCLICQKDAAICASTRAHGLEALLDRTGFLLYVAGRSALAEYIAAQAYSALLLELVTTPKPGLVDRNNNGAHTDMEQKHFLASAIALRPFFCRMAETGFLTRDLPPEETFRKIRAIGLDAENAMLGATRGVNTHKGAIFSIGLMCAAAGRTDPAGWTASVLCKVCSDMVKGIVARELGGVTPVTAKTSGEKFYALYGVTGARGQAENGFPAVLNVGLPRLQEGLAQGMGLADAGCAVLLHLIAAQDDTNLIHRGSREIQLQLRQQIGSLLEKTPFPSQEQLLELDRQLIEKNLSPGGSADLLALTYLLHLLT